MFVIIVDDVFSEHENQLKGAIVCLNFEQILVTLYFDHFERNSLHCSHLIKQREEQQQEQKGNRNHTHKHGKYFYDRICGLSFGLETNPS